MNLFDRVQTQLTHLIGKTLQEYCERKEDDHTTQLWCQAVNAASLIGPDNTDPNLVQARFLAGADDGNLEDATSYTLQCRDNLGALHCDLFINTTPFRAPLLFGCAETYPDKFPDAGDAIASADLADISPNEDATPDVKSEDVEEVAQDATEDIEDVFDALGDVVEDVEDIVDAVAPDAVEDVIDTIDTVIADAEDVADALEDIVEDVADAFVPNDGDVIADTVADVVADADAIADVVQDIVADAGDVVGDVADAVADAFDAGQDVQGPIGFDAITPPPTQTIDTGPTTPTYTFPANTEPFQLSTNSFSDPYQQFSGYRTACVYPTAVLTEYDPLSGIGIPATFSTDLFANPANNPIAIVFGALLPTEINVQLEPPFVGKSNEPADPVVFYLDDDPCPGTPPGQFLPSSLTGTPTWRTCDQSAFLLLIPAQSQNEAATVGLCHSPFSGVQSCWQFPKELVEDPSIPTELNALGLQTCPTQLEVQP